MAEDKFCLRWNEFEANIQVAFQQLRDDKDFFDVTLACDGEQVQAHKMILSACSPFFHNILRLNPHPHPLLYLKGVKFTDLQSVLNFMYHGEVNVAQEDLNTFLAVAEDLKVKGLTENRNASSKIKADLSPPPKRPKTVQLVSQHETKAQITDDDDIQEVFHVKTEARDISEDNNLAMETYQDQHDNYGGEEYGHYGHHQMEDAEYAVKGNDRGSLNEYLTREMAETGYIFVCTLCGKSNNQKNNMLNHVEGVHFPNTFEYHCKYCQKILKTKNTLYQHMFNFHKERSKHV